MTSTTSRIAVFGAGNMGSALISGLIRGGAEGHHITVYEANPVVAERIGESLGVNAAGSAQEAVAEAEVVLIAVKPHVVSAVLSDIAPHLSPHALVVSVAAGWTLAALEEPLPASTAIVRMMPNTPVAVGQGTLVVTANEGCTTEHKTLLYALFEGCGTVVDVAEHHQAVATALSGSGPAYVCLVTQALIDAGVAHGLTREVATALTVGMVRGTGELLHSTSGHPTLVKEQVTSPGGTTAQALRALQDGGVPSAFYDAVDAVVERTAQLA